MTSNVLVAGVPFSEIPPDTLFDPVRGVINSLIYADPGIYELELERVFGRSWLFICHDSHIPKYGDYFSTYMAEDPVVAVRQRDGTVRVLLNQCRHRGMKVCRSDAGNARAFTCTYHGWAYDLAGNLVSVPMQEMSFPPDFDRGQWGLRQPRVDTYKGLVFATWNADAPSLRDYLGDAAFYLDALVDRGPNGAVAIGGVMKWVIPCNWKFAAEQFASDMYHGDMSHMSAMLGAVKQATGEYERQPAPAEFGRQFSDPNSGHGTGFFVLPESNHPFRALQSGQTVPGFDPAAIYARQQAHSAAHSMMMAQHMTVFPTFSFFAGVNTVRTWHPRGPNEIEVWAFCLADADATPAEREQLRQASLRTFAPSGTWEQDDGENWVEIQRVLRGREARRTMFNAQMGMGRDFGQDAAYPHTVNQAYNEGSARGLYTRWRTLMTTPDERPVQLQGFAHAAG